jgi:DNA repair protein RecN (Recombination protein N)
MLVELHVRELGVIADLDVVLGPGLTAITGETGAGKTLVVEALGLLLGGRAEASIVRVGADEALVEGRFLDDGGGEETVLSRVVPAAGRSRGFANGRMAPVSQLAEIGRGLVDLYGQHDHHSLLQPSVQRQALDRFAGVDLAAVRELRHQIAELDARIEALGGDERTRARELDLLRYELGEIAALAITSAEEDGELASEEAVLSSAASLAEAVARAHDRLAGEGAAGAIDNAGGALSELERHAPLAPLSERLRSVLAELEDVASELRRSAERFEEDPARLAAVGERRQRLHAVTRKHGEHLGDVLEFAEAARRRIDELEAADEARAALELERAALQGELVAAERVVGDVRRAAAPRLGEAVEAHFAELGLARSRLLVEIPETGIGDAVELLLCANPGEPFLPLGKAASGGELARTMLALRLVLTSSPPTLVFDEVDAGIGGRAALAVGRALADLGRERQVLVVTHLAQVAAHADRQIAVAKSEEGGRTVTRARVVEGDERLAELSRMLSGHPGSEAARHHAAELLSSVRGS